MPRLARSHANILAAFLTTALLGAACGEPPPTVTEEDNGAAADSGPVDGGVATDSEEAADTVSSNGGSDAAVADDTAAVADTSSSSGGADATTSGGDDATADATVEVDAGPEDAGPPPKKLPLPDCAKGACFNCDKCADTPMCLDGKTFKNDCQAICDLKAFDWPTGYTPTQGACPDCKECIGHKIQCNTQKGECEECNAKDGCKSNGDSCKNETDCKWTPVCATLKSGAAVTVDIPCKAGCLDLKTDAGINPKFGACKSKCSFPVSQGGGGCPNNVWSPVCSKKDGKTYTSECAMQNCGKQGCYAVGQSGATTQCEETKMEVECQGECWDADNLAWKGCTGDCAPVCGIAKDGKGISFRNKCVASAEGAKVSSCEGVTATKADKCSAELYVDNAAPCCKDVQYEIVNPVCAALGDGNDAPWFTFRNKAEFDCWETKAKTDKTKPQWEFKYLGSCICKCPKTDKPVCGADGLTYQNACQAKCYNGDAFTWKDGNCGG